MHDTVWWYLPSGSHVVCACSMADPDEAAQCRTEHGTKDRPADGSGRKRTQN